MGEQIPMLELVEHFKLTSDLKINIDSDPQIIEYLKNGAVTRYRTKWDDKFNFSKTPGNILRTILFSCNLSFYFDEDTLYLTKASIENDTLPPQRSCLEKKGNTPSCSKEYPTTSNDR